MLTQRIAWRWQQSYNCFPCKRFVPWVACNTFLGWQLRLEAPLRLPGSEPSFAGTLPPCYFQMLQQAISVAFVWWCDDSATFQRWTALFMESAQVSGIVLAAPAHRWLGYSNNSLQALTSTYQVEGRDETATPRLTELYAGNKAIQPRRKSLAFYKKPEI